MVKESLKGIDLTEAGLMYLVNAGGLNERARKYLDTDGDWTYVSASDIEKIYDLDADAYIDLSSAELDEGEAEWIFASLIKDAKHYLVFATGCRWNGASGYKIATSPADAVARDYDAAIYPRRSSKGMKTLCCHEASHDVPTGNETIIVALTDKEFEYLDNASFEQVAGFAQKCADRCH
ncbi:MAG: hypothetical protein IJI45_06670 [Anaerolineaceae bacterium]|nr:hypothetical protein [Anaerolineaceae bacterium]